jgi:Na+/melibiose symporter-like transporter
MGGKENRMRKRLTFADRIAVSVGLLALAAGVVVLVLARGTLAWTIAVCLLGVAGVAFVALVFLLVGESEDRYYRRERNEKKHRRPPKPTAPG